MFCEDLVLRMGLMFEFVMSFFIFLLKFRWWDLNGEGDRYIQIDFELGSRCCMFLFVKCDLGCLLQIQGMVCFMKIKMSFVQCVCLIWGNWKYRVSFFCVYISDKGVGQRGLQEGWLMQRVSLFNKSGLVKVFSRYSR